MFNKKNHVGRPSNIEIKQRRNQKILFIIIPIIVITLVVTLIITDNFNNLMENSVTNYYCEDNSYTLNWTLIKNLLIK